MLGPRSENTIEDGNHNTQVGHNSGTVTIGLTFEQHQTALQDAVSEKATDLERAHGAEKDLIQRELFALKDRFADVEADYQARLDELSALKQQLAKYDNQIPRDKLHAAYAALDRDDTTLAEALFQEALVAAVARREEASKEEAGLHFQLGLIAEGRVNWAEAATHYDRAARLYPTFGTLLKASAFSGRAGDYARAYRYSGDSLELARNADDQTQYANALNDHAMSAWEMGEFVKAENFLRQALVIVKATLGENHPSYSICLSNLASAIGSQNRFAEAESLYQQVLAIDRLTVGEMHPQFADHLNNLAFVISEQGRYAEAEDLYRQGLGIKRETIGDGHPAYAVGLSNLAGVVFSQERLQEAEALNLQAIAIDRASLGDAHPSYAIHLSNLAEVLVRSNRTDEAELLFRQTLSIFESILPDNHPHIAKAKRILSSFLADHNRPADP